MTITSVALNGTNIEDLGLRLSEDSGLHSIPAMAYPVLDVPLRRGQWALSAGSTQAPREINLRFSVEPTSWTDRRTRLDALAALFSGAITVTAADAPGRACVGLLQTMDVTSAWRTFAVLPVNAACKIICHDPLWYDVEPIITAIDAGARGTIAMGTGPASRVLVSVEGPVTGPFTVILRDQTGAEVSRMTFSGSLTGSQSLEIDCAWDAHTVMQQPEGTDRLDWLTPTHPFFDLRPPFGYTLECSSAAMTVTHYRSWLT